MYDNTSNKTPAINSCVHSAANTLPAVAFIGPPAQPWLLFQAHRSPQNQEVSADKNRCHQGALDWHHFGLNVIPIPPGTKKTAVKWDPWLNNLSTATIDAHWGEHPDHEVGFIVGDGLTVFDTDSPEADVAFNQLMESFDLSCNHVIGTTKGKHYYFRRAESAFARSDSHDTEQYPDRIDVKTGRALVVLPPSTGKSVSMSEAESVADLVKLDQGIIDAVFRHNGRDAPRKQANPPTISTPITGPVEEQLVNDARYWLEYVDPDCGYDDWVMVGMALHSESAGSDSCFDLFDTWSAGGQKYPGSNELRSKWDGFGGYQGNPVTLASICKLAAENGADLSKVPEEYFTAIEDVNDVAGVYARVIANLRVDAVPHDLKQFSLRGKGKKFAAEMQEHRFVLEDIAIAGQWTMVFAPPNTGKTLIAFWLLIESTTNGEIDPEHVIYINADDGFAGVTEKLCFADEAGFHTLAPGHAGFQARDLLVLLKGIGASGQARETIVVLDTIKKFANPMDKNQCLLFGNAVREFTSKGGTVIGLSHTNKNRAADGKPIPAGTSDFVDDADCSYVMDTLDDNNDICTVGFENIKNRGKVAKEATYQYSTKEGMEYLELLDSVTPVDSTQAGKRRKAAAMAEPGELPVIQAITQCIAKGVTTKKKIIKKAASIANDSKRRVERVLDKHTGTDPNQHKWKYAIGARGAKTFELLPPANEEEDIENIQD